MNRLAPKLDQPTHEEEKTDDKPAVENNITSCNGIVKKSMVVHDACRGINGQP